MDNDDYDREYFTIKDLFGTASNVYPLVYALKINNFRDFHYAVVREAYYVGMSVLNEEPTHEVVFWDEFDGEILTEYDDDFPYTALPSMGVYINYEAAKEGCRELNAMLINEYEKTHFDYEVNDAIEEMKRAGDYEDKYIYKDINRGIKNPTIFSTVYVKTKKVN